MKISEVVVIYRYVLKFHQVSLNLNERQNSFFNDTFNLDHPLRAGEFRKSNIICCSNFLCLSFFNAKKIYFQKKVKQFQKYYETKIMTF